MRKKPSRRLFLSALGLSAAGIGLPKVARGEPTQNGYTSVRQLYESCVLSEERVDQPTTILDELFAKGPDKALIDRAMLPLAPGCTAQVKALLDEHKIKKDRAGKLEWDDLKAAIKKNRWGLRRPGDPIKFENSACPWGDCPA